MIDEHAVASIDSKAVDTASPRSTYARFSYGISAAALCAGLLALVVSPQLSILMGAIICGWSEVSGFCGCAHVSSLAVIRRLEGPRRWLAATLAYTLGGVATAAVTGAIIGWLLNTLLFRILEIAGSVFVVVLLVLAAVLIARELRALSFSLPQVHRQTEKLWAQEFGFVTAAGMWGAHIGIGVATVIAHGGFFVLIAAIALLGAKFGAVAMAVYWLGRTLPMWLGPLLAFDRPDEALREDVHEAETSYRHAAVAGIALISLAVLWAAQ